jgi:hypothetical protein
VAQLIRRLASVEAQALFLDIIILFPRPLNSALGWARRNTPDVSQSKIVALFVLKDRIVP